MAGYVLLVSPPQYVDLGQLVTVTTSSGFNMPIARRIDTSQAEEVALAVRMQSAIPVDNTINFYLAQDGYTSEDPTDEYGPFNASGGIILTALATVGPLTSTSNTPALILSASSPTPAGGLVQVYMNVTRTTGSGAGTIRFSTELHMKTGSASAYTPAAGSYLGFGIRRV
ncbi:MAG: hypothetical protein ACHREM_18190 [Polyangiales bacterium]